MSGSGATPRPVDVHEDSLQAHLFFVGLACTLSSPGSTRTTPVLSHPRHLVATQVLQQREFAYILTPAIHHMRLWARTLVSIIGHFLTHLMELAPHSTSRGSWEKLIRSVTCPEHGGLSRISIFFPKDGTFLQIKAVPHHECFFPPT